MQMRAGAVVNRIKALFAFIDVKMSNRMDARDQLPVTQQYSQQDMNEFRAFHDLSITAE